VVHGFRFAAVHCAPEAPSPVITTDAESAGAAYPSRTLARRDCGFTVTASGAGGSVTCTVSYTISNNPAPFDNATLSVSTHIPLGRVAISRRHRRTPLPLERVFNSVVHGCRLVASQPAVDAPVPASVTYAESVIGPEPRTTVSLPEPGDTARESGGGAAVTLIVSNSVAVNPGKPLMATTTVSR